MGRRRKDNFDFIEAEMCAGFDQVPDDARVPSRLFKGLAECSAVHHQVAKDGPTASLGKLPHVQTKIRVMGELRRPFLDQQICLDWYPGIRRFYAVRVDPQGTKEFVNIHFQGSEIDEHL